MSIFRGYSFRLPAHIMALDRFILRHVRYLGEKIGPIGVRRPPLMARLRVQEMLRSGQCRSIRSPFG
jgi:hypothetical protein